MIFSKCLLVSISCISALIFMFFFFFYFCLSFSSSFRFKMRLFTWDFSCFLRQIHIVINFPPRASFPASQRFWIIFLLFSFLPNFFFFLISSVILWLFHSMLLNLHICSVFVDFFFPLVICSLIELWLGKMIYISSLKICIMQKYVWF